MSPRLGAQIRQLVPVVSSRVGEVAASLSYELTMMVSLAVIFPITIRGLGTEGYGEYTVLYVIAGFGITWVHSGVAAATIQLVLQRGRNTWATLALGQRQASLLALPVGITAFVVAMAILGPHLWFVALVILANDLIVLGWTEVRLAVVYSHRGAVPTSRIRMAGPVLRLVGVAALGLSDQVTILNLVLVNSAASAAVLGITTVVCRRMKATHGAAGSDPSWRELLGLGAMYSSSMTTNAVQNEGEKVVLAAYRPTAEVGEYQAGYRIVSVALLPIRALHGASPRWFLSLDERPGRHVYKSILLSIPSALYGLGVLAGVVIAQPIIAWVLGAEFEAAVTITLWLAAVPLLHALAEIPPLGLIGLGQNRVRMYLGLGTAFVALVGYLLLVPRFGWQGAVIGTYVSEMVALVGGWILLIRCQRRIDRERSTVEPTDPLR
jgi:O-antigen/teichoic acid export membrane protein